jgi:hypothetical protein
MNLSAWNGLTSDLGDYYLYAHWLRQLHNDEIIFLSARPYAFFRQPFFDATRSMQPPVPTGWGRLLSHERNRRVLNA